MLYLKQERINNIMLRIAKELSLKNLKKNKFRTTLMIILISFLSISLFLGMVIITSLRNGINNYKDRLGADVIVVPYEATTKSTVDDILLQGISGNYYVSSAYYNKVKKIDGVEKISAQFYLTSAKAACCSSRVQIIGFDPETDFSIQPWIEKSYSKTIGDDDIVVGSNINVTESMKIKFYGDDYNVVAQLAKTGTGLDSAVYCNINTIKKMAETSNALEYNEELADIDIENSVSAIFIKVKDGYDATDVAAKINSSVKGIKAQSSTAMVSNVSSGLDGISTIIGVLLAVIWVLVSIILVVTFVLMTYERKKEFAILRSIGASRSMLAKIISLESVMLSGVSSLIGIFITALALIPISFNLNTLFNLPFVFPDIPIIILYAFITLIATVLICFLTSLKSSYDISKNDAAILIREDA